MTRPTQEQEWRAVARKRLQDAAKAERERDLWGAQFARHGAALALRNAAKCARGEMV